MTNDEKAERRRQLEQSSTQELLVSLHIRLDELDAWRQKVDDRLKEGEKRFERLELNSGLLMNSLQALCEVRGLTDQAAKLEDAIESLGRRLADDFRDEKTNPDLRG